MTAKTTMMLIFSALLAGSVPAWASLGDSVTSVASDQRMLEGQLRSTQMQGYSVHEITQANGMVITEYVSEAGLVFGVSWSGPNLPDLSSLLGSSFSAFQSANQRASANKTRARGPIVVRNGDLTVESHGHMRAFRGRAFLNSLLPSGVTAAVVK
jgi:Protein of unknown function (DUF2844)